MASIKRVTVKDEYRSIIKRLKRKNNVLIILIILSVLMNMTSICYMYITDPEVNVGKVYTKIKDKACTLYSDMVK